MLMSEVYRFVIRGANIHLLLEPSRFAIPEGMGGKNADFLNAQVKNKVPGKLKLKTRQFSLALLKSAANRNSAMP